MVSLLNVNFHVICLLLIVFREQVVDGVASVMRTTVINSSKEMSAYSDFPPPPEFANFMHHTSVIKYLELYAAKFDLRRHIHFRYEVINIAQKDDVAGSGQWTVVVRNMEVSRTCVMKRCWTMTA